VCSSLEKFFDEVLRPSRQWLKIAGGEKAELLISALRRAPANGVILEIGTYFGYSALRIAMSQPGRRVVTVEVDPVHASVAQSLIMYAGLAHRIDVWTGHSKDVLTSLSSHYPSFLIAAVFMDQCGSRFWEDLEALMRFRVLARGSIIVADNTLKPGAPTFLWRLLYNDSFEVSIASVTEFAMPGVEDWLAIAEYVRPGMKNMSSQVGPSRELEELEWWADRMRVRAVGPGGVSFEDWAIFSSWMRQRLSKLGIAPTIVATTAK